MFAAATPYASIRKSKRATRSAVVGGLKLADRAADLAVAMTIASAAAGRKLDDGLVVFGKVGYRSF